MDMGLVKMNKIKNSVVIYKGPSLAVPDTEIAVILAGINGKSDNSKIGNMAQMWIITTTSKPSMACANGNDKAVCGNCQQRPVNNGNCYVNKYHMYKMHKALTDNRYEFLAPKDVGISLAEHNTKIRITAYGDIAVIPNASKILTQLIGNQEFTAYTHLFTEPFFDQDLLKWCILSVDSLAHRLETQNKFPNCKTYRVLAKNEVKQDGEVMCPSRKIPLPHGGFRRNIQCQTCLLCNSNSKFDITVNAISNNFKGGYMAKDN